MGADNDLRPALASEERAAEEAVRRYVEQWCDAVQLGTPKPALEDITWACYTDIVRVTRSSEPWTPADDRIVYALAVERLERLGYSIHATPE